MNPFADLIVYEHSERLSARFAGQILALCGARVCIPPHRTGPAAATPVEAAEDEFLDRSKERVAWASLRAPSTTGTVVAIRTAGAPLPDGADPAGVPVVEVAPFAFAGAAKDWQAEALVLSHASGLGYITPGGVSLDHPPLRLPRKLVQRAAGLTIATAVLCLERLARAGQVRTARVSEIETLFPMLAPMLSPYLLGEGLPARNMAGPADLLSPCKDGEVTFSFVQESEWQRFAALVGRPEWGEIFAGYTTRRENWHAIVEMLADWLSARTKREIFDACQAARVPCGMVLRASDVLANEQVRGRAFLRPVHLSSLGRTCDLPGLPWRLVDVAAADGEGVEAGARPAPPRRPGPAPRPSPALAAACGDGALPLAGLRVLELGGFWAAPRCAAILAELGAEVIKVETVRRPDLRDVIVGEDGAVRVQSKPFFEVVNANKRACTLDLEVAEGRRLFLELVRRSDVVVENFRPGTLDRFGLGPAALRAANPRIVLVSLSGFGQEGPYRGHSAYGPIVESMSGVRSLLGYAGERRTHLAGVSYADPLSGALGALACLVALARAERLGTAVQVDCSQIEGLLAVAPELLIEHAVTGADPEPGGNREGHAPPYGLYRCAGEDRWLAVGFRPGDSWAAFCEVLGLPGPVRRDYADGAVRRRCAAEVDALVADAVRGRDAFVLAAALQARGIPAAPCHTLRDLLDGDLPFDPGAFVFLGADADPRRRTYGAAIRFDGARPLHVDPAPTFGADNEYVFGELLALPAAHRAALAGGAIR
jgi:crotonobetainyl-CoA:carnitine CoA-transferase CaiB-like acyl-CoA transferase